MRNGDSSTSVSSAAAGARRLGVLLGVVLFTAGLCGTHSASGQDNQIPDGVNVKAIEIVGLQSVSEAFVRRSLKTREGAPFVRADVEADVRELLRTRKFLIALASPRVEGGDVIIAFTLQEKPTISTVEVEGNKKFTDEKLYEVTPAAGSPLDRYEINRGRDDIIQKYKEKGYYYVTVEIDEQLLQQENRVVYRIVEGPRVRTKKIAFEGNRSFGDLRLASLVQTQTYIWIFRAGALDEDTAQRDAASIQKYYRDEGYLDARVGYRLDFDPVKREDLTLVFVIEEGDRYRVREVAFEGATVFQESRLREQLKLEPESFLRDVVVQEDVKRVQDLYGEIGYIEARIDTQPDFVEEPGYVVLRYVIEENEQFRFGRITIRGNEETKDEVIRRELLFYPGQLYNAVEVRKAQQRIRETYLFVPDKVDIQPIEAGAGEKEALVTVAETETTRYLFGFGISTDNGLIGSLTLDYRNFDLFKLPRNFNEFFSGRAFKGDGQRLLVELEPGTEVSRFRISFTEPYLFDMPVRFDTSAFLFTRGRDGYDETRYGLTFGLSRRFRGGLLDGFALEGATRLELVEIDNLDSFAARPIREAKGSNPLFGIKGAIVRDTTDSRVFPTEGYRISFSWEQVWVAGEEKNWSFGKPMLSAAWYKTLSTDILDRKSVFALRGDVGYIVGDAPVFEKFYAGGFGSLRGFSYRTISPRRGIRNQTVGGDFLFLTGGEYSFPLYGKEFRGVLFCDMGTVSNDFSLDSWRLSVGFGLRVTLNFFGPIPLVFDFGFPLNPGDRENTQIFQFAAGASF